MTDDILCPSCSRLKGREQYCSNCKCPGESERLKELASPDRIIIQWSCGCAVYQDRTGRKWEQGSMFCTAATHRAEVVQSTREGEAERQGGLFS